MQYIGSLKAAEKHISAKIFQENLHTSVKSLQICINLQDSVQRSLQNPADLHRLAKIENLGNNSDCIHSKNSCSSPLVCLAS